MSDEATKQAFDAWYENYPDLDSYDQGMLDAFAAGRAFALETAAAAKECICNAQLIRAFKGPQC